MGGGTSELRGLESGAGTRGAMGAGTRGATGAGIRGATGAGTRGLRGLEPGAGASKYIGRGCAK